MKVIPVLDLLNGCVVHGIAGMRSSYRPIENSAITNSIVPIDVVRSFEKKFGFKSFYMADLDLIQQT